eukprot:939705-Prymnesium_polylepis.1
MRWDAVGCGGMRWDEGQPRPLSPVRWGTPALSRAPAPARTAPPSRACRPRPRRAGSWPPPPRLTADRSGGQPPRRGSPTR